MKFYPILILNNLYLSGELEQDEIAFLRRLLVALLDHPLMKFIEILTEVFPVENHLMTKDNLDDWLSSFTISVDIHEPLNWYAGDARGDPAQVDYIFGGVYYCV